MGFFSRIIKSICASVVVFVGILLGPNPLPDSVKFTEYDVSPVKNLGKGFAKNDLLNNAERLFEDEIKGPEGFAVLNGELYTTLHGGFVAKIYDDQVIPVVKFGEPCVGWWEESKCGRPLGIKTLGNDHLIVADTYFGIHKYNINTRKSVTLVDKNEVIDGKPTKLFNDVEITKDGAIYWTHSSTDFTIQDGIYTFLADGSGRLLKYDPVTKKNTVLLKDLFFPNGLVLSPNEDYLLVAETGHSRVLKYYLKGPKRFTTEVFIDGLPGMPDNLRRNGDGGYFVPLGITRDEKSAFPLQLVSNFPSLRKFAARFLSLIELFLTEVDKIYPNYYTKRATHFVGHLESIGIFFSANTILLEVDLNGNVIRSFHGSDGSVGCISDVIPHNGYLYLGSSKNNFLARVKLSKLGITPPVRRLEPSAPPSTTSRPTTTTTTTIRPPTTTTTTTTTTTRPPTTTTTTTTTTTRPPTTTTTTTTTTTRPPTTTTRPPPTTRAISTTTTRPPPTTTKFPQPPRTTQQPPTPQPRTVTPKPNPPPRSNPPSGQNEGGQRDRTTQS